ncbi:hypothetical protein [Aureibaculum luteum]|uniref:hypothetical protein n=1 Tax=Aureibaculum luteum TaxID=1548456 RepID=UPI000E512D8B|nr:hypothetical protein [Aureibaculum luteum]
MKLFVISSVIFLINQIFQYFNIGIVFSTSYLDDLLFFPITLSIIKLYENRRSANYKIPVKHTIIGLLIISVLFEIIIPKIDLRFTGDYIDVIFYSLGAIVYHLTNLNKKRELTYSRNL